MQAILETYDGVHNKLHTEDGMYVVVAHTTSEQWHLRMLASSLASQSGGSFIVIDLPESWPFQNTMPINSYVRH